MLFCPWACRADVATNRLSEAHALSHTRLLVQEKPLRSLFSRGLLADGLEGLLQGEAAWAARPLLKVSVLKTRYDILNDLGILLRPTRIGDDPKSRLAPPIFRRASRNRRISKRQHDCTAQYLTFTFISRPRFALHYDTVLV